MDLSRLRSDEAKWLAKHLDGSPPTERDIASMRAAELAHIPRCEGRIYGHNESGSVDVNRPKQMNGARFMSFDPIDKTVGIRLDVKDLPDVWLEIHLDLKQMQQWIDSQTSPDDE
jgi:hypothetical protein